MKRVGWIEVYGGEWIRLSMVERGDHYPCKEWCTCKTNEAFIRYCLVVFVFWLWFFFWQHRLRYTQEKKKGQCSEWITLLCYVYRLTVRSRILDHTLYPKNKTRSVYSLSLKFVATHQYEYQLHSMNVSMALFNKNKLKFSW
jgi:hypothetical protein